MLAARSLRFLLRVVRIAFSLREPACGIYLPAGFSSRMCLCLIMRASQFYEPCTFAGCPHDKGARISAGLPHATLRGVAAVQNGGRVAVHLQDANRNSVGVAQPSCKAVQAMAASLTRMRVFAFLRWCFLWLSHLSAGFRMLCGSSHFMHAGPCIAGFRMFCGPSHSLHASRGLSLPISV